MEKCNVSTEYSIGDIRKMKTSKRETETNERHKKENK